MQLIELKIEELWISTFKVLKLKLLNLEREKEAIAINYKWTELAKYQKENQIIFFMHGTEYCEMKKYFFPFLD